MTRQPTTPRWLPTPARHLGKLGYNDGHHVARRLTNYNHGYSIAMSGTVAPCQTLVQRGHKTMTIAMPGRASEDGATCKCDSATTGRPERCWPRARDRRVIIMTTRSPACLHHRPSCARAVQAFNEIRQPTYCAWLRSVTHAVPCT